MGKSAKKEIRSVTFCPHCNNTAPQTLVHTQEFEDTVFLPSGKKEIWECFYHVAYCNTCGGILVYYDAGRCSGPDCFADTNLVWPQKKTLPFMVPKHITQIYEEAALIQKASPDAFAVQIRRGLEAICAERGIKGKTLNIGLKELAERGEIPKVLVEATDVLRLLGNVGAHWTGQHVHPSQIPALDDFFKAVVEYIFVAPSKLQEFKNQLEAFKKSGEVKE